MQKPDLPKVALFVRFAHSLLAAVEDTEKAGSDDEKADSIVEHFIEFSPQDFVDLHLFLQKSAQFVPVLGIAVAAIQKQKEKKR